MPGPSAVRIKGRLGSLLLVLASLLVSIAVVELAGGLFLPRPPERILLQHPLALEAQAERHGFLPETEIREVALYGQPGNLRVEYDVTYRTNNLGLVQRRAIRGGVPHVVVVGDSFTQGQGANPWFYELEGELSDRPLVNLGIVGTGVQHWERSLHAVSLQVPVEAVLFVLIADDWHRPRWVGRTTRDSHTSFCRGPEDCYKVFFAMPKDASSDQVLEAARRALQTSSETGRERLRRMLESSVTGRAALGAFRSVRSGASPEIARVFEENAAAFKSIVGRYPVIGVIHLPEKEEVRQGAWSQRSSSVRDRVRLEQARYVDGMQACGLKPEDFLPEDSHPNSSGYRKIRDCVTREIRSARDRRKDA